MTERNDFFDDLINDDSEQADSVEREAEDNETVSVRTVLLEKNDMLALLGLRTSHEGGLVIRVDPRQSSPAAQKYEDAESATRWFNRSLATSKRNGWSVIHDGQPLFG